MDYDAPQNALPFDKDFAPKPACFNMWNLLKYYVQPKGFKRMSYIKDFKNNKNKNKKVHSIE